MQHFAGSKNKVQSFDCDNAPELIAAATALKWRLATATTGMPQTNGVAENCVRKTKEGSGCGIVQSWVEPDSFWGSAGEHYCFSTNIAIIDGDSSYNRRHKIGHFKGQQIPFGALVDFMPQPDTKVASMGAKTIPGIFLGYHVHAGGLWSGDYLVAERDPFRQDCDVARSKVKIYRINEVVIDRSGKFVSLSHDCDRRGSDSTGIAEHLLTLPNWTTRATTTLPRRLAVALTVWCLRKGDHSPPSTHLTPLRRSSTRR